MSDYKSSFIDTPLGEYFEASPKGIAFPMYKKTVLNNDSFEEEESSDHPCGKFINQFFYAKTDYATLAKYLTRNHSGKTFTFGYKKYIKTIPDNTKTIPNKVTGGEKVKKGDFFTESIPFTYEENGEQKKAVFAKAYFNPKVCKLERSFSVQIKIKPGVDREKSSTFFSISFYYKDTEQYRNKTVFSGQIQKFTIPDKYKAIELQTRNANTLYHFISKISPRSKKGIENSLTDKFNKAFKTNAANNPEVLDWLYEQTPDFILQKKDKEVLWDDLTKLLKFDKDKWFIDSSTAMIKAMKAIINNKSNDKSDNKTGIEYLYNQFYFDSRLVKDIYHFLDGIKKSALHNGQLVPNKTVFASLLTQISAIETHRRKGKLKYKRTSEGSTPQATFRLTKGYRVDSNTWSDDKYLDAYNLTQQKETAPDDFENDGETQYLQPLDIVSLIIEGESGKDVIIEVPAIFVKDLAYHREWGEIMEVIRIGTDILAIILGVVTIIFTGSPFFFALAVADIGIAGYDLYVQAKKDEYMQTKEGRDFLRNWESIYNTVGLGIAVLSAPALVRSTLRLGLSIYRGATGATKEFLKIAIFKIILETNIHNFTGNTLKNIDIGIHIFKDTGVAFKIGPMTRLQKNGVFFVRLIGEGSDRATGFIAVYKGEVIAQGTAKEVRNGLKPIFSLKGTKLTNILDNFLPNWRFKHIPTSKALITENTKKGSYLVGAWPSDLRFILKELKYPVFENIELLRKNYTFPLPNGQRFNLLNVSESVVRYFGRKGGFFNRVNTKWIDAAVERGDEIFIVTSMKRGHLYRRVEIKGEIKYVLTGFGKEIHRLEWKHGYRFDFKTKQMIPPGNTKSTKTFTKFENNKIIN